MTIKVFKKYDENKPKPHLIPKEPLLEIAKVAGVGAEKYGEWNWKECDDPNRYLDALYRHLFAYESGEENDPETGLSHLAHAGCSLLFLMWLKKNQ